MTLDPAYVHARYMNPTQMKNRDLGRAIAEVLHMSYAPEVRKLLVLDSETVTDGLGSALLLELRNAGYAVTFTGRKAAHK
jgi:hypothetical protein